MGRQAHLWLYADAVIVIPPRAFWRRVTRTPAAVELERLGDLVADLDGERFAEDALVVEARQVDLQRLRLEAQPARLEAIVAV